ncbi:hypothetical protein GGI07_003467 [Coemansia sp. Benny D115]|nr:hypothetical protein GGI07_003467 [Coemansia sp. Benny D115]
MFWTPVKLFIGDLFVAIDSGLSLGSPVFFIGNEHVIRSVEVIGVVVSVDERSFKMSVYRGKYLDDGTGTISCVQFTTAEEQSNFGVRQQSLDLGMTVCIQGRLSMYREERQVVVRSCTPVEPNQETLGWLERLSLRKYLATSPFQQH